MATTATAATGVGSNGQSAYENVQVAVRMRPINGKETAEKDTIIVKCDKKNSKIVVNKEFKSDSTAGIILGNQTLNKTKEWTLDRVFDETTNQAEIFESLVKPVVDEVLKGYSCTVFAYGQTGTGKTFTMEGGKDSATGALIEEQKGVIARSVDYIFEHLEKGYSKDAPLVTQAQAQAASKQAPGAAGAATPQLGEWAVKISYLEIYNEKLDDLLSYGPPTAFEKVQAAAGGGGGGGAQVGEGPSAAGGGTSLGTTGAANAVSAGLDGGESGPCELKIVEAGAAGKEKDGASVRVAGLEEFHVTCAKDCFEHLKRGSLKRATAATNMNKNSSRSHCVFTLTITMKDVFDGQDCYRVGRLNLVDLAGSESVGRSGATDKRAREAGSINTSLLTLGRVITALVEKQPHVPYRDSKLTRLLQDSLGGRTKTVMIATVSPALANAEETISTLEYASRAKKILNKPEQMSKMEKKELTAAHVRQLEELRARLKAMIDKNGGNMAIPEAEYKKLKGVEAELEAAKVAHAAEKAELERQLAEVRAELAVRSQELAESMAAHAVTCARLAQVEAELASMRAELEAMTRAHEDAQAVIRGQAAVEAALTGQALRTGESLRAAAGDVQGLHAKVSRVRSTMNANRGVADSYGQGAAARLAALCGEAEAWSGQQCARAQELQAGAQAFAQESSVELAGLLAQLAKVKGDAGAYAKGVAGGAGGLEGEVTATVSSALAAVAGAQDKAAAEAQQQAGVMAAHLARIAAALEAQAVQLAAWHGGSVSFLTSLSASTAAFAQGTHASLTALQAAVAGQAAAVDAQMAEQARALAEAQARAEAGTEAAAAALLAQVSASVASFVQGRKEEGAALTAGLLAGTGRTRAAVAGLQAEVHAGLGSLGAAVSSWAGEAQGQVAEAQGQAGEELRGCVATVQEGQAGVDAGKAALPVAVAAHTAAAVAVASTSSAALQGLQAGVAGYASRAKSGALSYSDGSSRAVEALVASAQARAARGKAFAESAVALGEAVHGGASRAAEGVRGWAGAEGAALHCLLSESLQPEPITGTTPGKRDYPLPAALLASSPPAHVAKRFRAAKEGGAATPAADAQAWGAKVEPSALPPFVPCVPAAASFMAPVETAGGGVGLVRKDSAGAQALVTFSARLAQVAPMPAPLPTTAPVPLVEQQQEVLMAMAEAGPVAAMQEVEAEPSDGRLSVGSSCSSSSSSSSSASGAPTTAQPYVEGAELPGVLPAEVIPMPVAAEAATAAPPAPVPARVAVAAAGKEGGAGKGPMPAPAAAGKRAPAAAPVASKGKSAGASENSAPAAGGVAGKGGMPTVATTAGGKGAVAGAAGKGGGAVTGARKVAGPGAARAKGLTDATNTGL